MRRKSNKNKTLTIFAVIINLIVMKKQILDALSTKFTGVRADILEKFANKLAAKVTTEEEIASVVEGVSFQDLMDSYTDSRVNDAVRGAISKYEKQYGIKDGKPLDNPNPAPEPNPAPQPDANAALLAAIQALTAKVDGFERNKVKETRQGAINSIISALPENLRKPYARMSFDGMSDDDFNALQSEIQSEVDTIKTDLNAKGAAYGVPQGSGNKPTGEASEADINALASSLGV